VQSIRDQYENLKVLRWGIPLLGIISLAQSSVASAQSDVESLAAAVRACQVVPSSSSRLACYDSVLPPMGELVADEESSDPREKLAVSELEPEPFPAQPERQRAEAAPALSEETRGRSVRPDPDDDPQLASTVSIIEVHTLASGQARFLDADGRVFQQWSGTTTLRLPDPPFEVELEPGAMGSTFFSLPESRRRFRVTSRD